MYKLVYMVFSTPSLNDNFEKLLLQFYNFGIQDFALTIQKWIDY